jgi:glycosyltransferase involved in cell wall biosynthesis
MKILIVNTMDAYGGAARAANRLHKALLAEGIESNMLVQKKTTNDYTVVTDTSKKAKIINILRPIIDQYPVKRYKNKTKTLFSTSNYSITDTVEFINKINPDIVHLHWVCGNMIKIEDFSKIKAPIVWSLHDMWAFTGGCHYDEECGKYMDQCGTCKVLNSSDKNDLSHKIFNKKKKVFLDKEMYIVGLSKWIHNCAKNSMLLKDKQHINLPNPIDISIYKPIDKKVSRNLWNLPEDKKLILFGAMAPTSDIRKGFNQLREALNKLNINNIEFVIFGSDKPKDGDSFNFPTYYLGSLSDDVSLVSLYSAVDVMIVPSLQENLSNAIVESISCGTPVVAFDIGGNKDIISHKFNGYLAKPFDTDDLKDGIEWVLKNPSMIKFEENCVNIIKTKFESTLVAKQYIELYKDILKIEKEKK